jgi:hypothetical protein
MNILSKVNTFNDLSDFARDILGESLDHQETVKRVAIFPGAYKPPHRGHYHTAATAAKHTDSLYIIISNSPREAVSGEVARDIWQVYQKYIEMEAPGVNIEVKMLDYAASPVAITYQLANILNNRQFVPGDKISDKEPLPGISDIGDEILQRYDSSNIELIPVAGKGDGGRYRGLMRGDKYSGENVTNIDILEVERLTSASSVRAAILSVANNEGDISTIRQNLPDVLTPEDEERVINILTGIHHDQG